VVSTLRSRHQINDIYTHAIDYRESTAICRTCLIRELNINGKFFIYCKNDYIKVIRLEIKDVKRIFG